MNQTVYGGVEQNSVIQFQTKLMLGAHFDKIENAIKKQDAGDIDKAKEDIIVACLRVAWIDAFRHVTRNVENLDAKFKKGGSLYPKYRNLNNYICDGILRSEVVLNTFKAFANAENTKEKVDVILDAIENKKLKDEFKEVKMLTDEKPLCFGHFQKMFNMALKIYLCLYVNKEVLNISNLMERFAFENADCPIDHYILAKIDECCSNKHPEYKEKLQNCYSKQNFTDITWSALTSEKDIKCYIFIQDVIHELLQDKSKSNLYFDFENWKK